MISGEKYKKIFGCFASAKDLVQKKRGSERAVNGHRL